MLDLPEMKYFLYKIVCIYSNTTINIHIRKGHSIETAKYIKGAIALALIAGIIVEEDFAVVGECYWLQQKHPMPGYFSTEKPGNGKS